MLNKKITLTILVFIIMVIPFSTTIAGKVNITKDIDFIEVQQGNNTIIVERNQDTNAVIDSSYAKTSRPCPPFCAQPMVVADGVKTIGEVELAQFMNSKLKDGRGLLIDARTPDWYEKGTIPGSLNIPYTQVNKLVGADEFMITDALETFGAKENDSGWDFSQAKILVLWCNGPWCGQSPVAIKGLLSLGYPANKLLYYRGGMQLWKVFGLNVIKPAK